MYFHFVIAYFLFQFTYPKSASRIITPNKRGKPEQTDIGTWLSIGQLTQTNAKVHKLQQIDQRKMWKSTSKFR